MQPSSGLLYEKEKDRWIISVRKAIAIFFVMIFLVDCAGSRQLQRSCLNQHSMLPVIGQAVSRLAYSNDLDPNKIYLCVLEGTEINVWIDKHPTIYLTTGFLDVMPGNDGLMCVLAHELSHYTLNHIANTQAVSLGVSAVFQIANVFVPGVGYLDHLANPTITRTYGRSNELDADENAVGMCKRAGMVNARKNMTDMLEWLKSYHKDSGRFFLWATHPPIDDRLENLNKNGGK